MYHINKINNFMNKKIGHPTTNQYHRKWHEKQINYFYLTQVIHGFTWIFVLNFAITLAYYIICFLILACLFLNIVVLILSWIFYEMMVRQQQNCLKIFTFFGLNHSTTTLRVIILLQNKEQRHDSYSGCNTIWIKPLTHQSHREHFVVIKYFIPSLKGTLSNHSLSTSREYVQQELLFCSSSSVQFCHNQSSLDSQRGKLLLIPFELCWKMFWLILLFNLSVWIGFSRFSLIFFFHCQQCDDQKRLAFLYC